jgi:hypothetical protein
MVLGAHVRRWNPETRDWTTWDEEHPYVPHPREPAAPQIDTSKVSSAKDTDFQQKTISDAEAEANLQKYLDEGQAKFPNAKDWYAQQNAMLNERAVSVGVTKDQYIGAVAATSPHCPWQAPVSGALMNCALADKVCAVWQANVNPATGKVDDPEGLVKSLTEPGQKGMMGTQLANGLKAMNGDYDAVGGAKTMSFFNNLENPQGTHDVTIDTWMGRAILDNPKLANKPSKADLADPTKAAAAKATFNKESQLLKTTIGSNTGANTKGGQASADQMRYGWAADRVRAVAERNGLRPNQAQALMWTAVQSQGGYGKR